MKRNTIFLGIFLSLLIFTYWGIEKKNADQYEKQRESQYLISWEKEPIWSLELDQGRLLSEGGVFFWEQQGGERRKIQLKDEKLLLVFNRFSDLRIKREISFDFKALTSFAYRDKQGVLKVEIGPLNPLTGNFPARLQGKKDGTFLIRDMGSLVELYSSLEEGQKIKYSKLVNMIKLLEWR